MNLTFEVSDKWGILDNYFVRKGLMKNRKLVSKMVSFFDLQRGYGFLPSSISTNLLSCLFKMMP